MYNVRDTAGLRAPLYCPRCNALPVGAGRVRATGIQLIFAAREHWRVAGRGDARSSSSSSRQVLQRILVEQHAAELDRRYKQKDYRTSRDVSIS